MCRAMLHPSYGGQLLQIALVRSQGVVGRGQASCDRPCFRTSPAHYPARLAISLQVSAVHTGRFSTETGRGCLALRLRVWSHIRSPKASGGGKVLAGHIQWSCWCLWALISPSAKGENSNLCLWTMKAHWDTDSECGPWHHSTNRVTACLVRGQAAPQPRTQTCTFRSSCGAPGCLSHPCQGDSSP